MTSHMTPPHLVISPQAPLGPPMPCSSSPAATAEAPELSYGEVWIITMYDLTVVQGGFFNWSYPKNHKYGKKYQKVGNILLTEKHL